MHSDQNLMRKYGISESIIQLSSYYDFCQLCLQGLYHGFIDAILSNLVTMHQAPGVPYNNIIMDVLALSLVFFIQSL